MEDKELQEILLKNYIYLTHSPCGFTWGMVSNIFYDKPVHAFESFTKHLNSLLQHDELHIEKIKDDVVSYILYHGTDKIITFYKSKKKKAKHGIVVFNDRSAFDIIFETIR
jgi:hypothetical protein